MQNSGIARYNPINGGFGIAGGWKGLSIRADFTYMLGKYLINNDGYFVGNPNSFFGYNQSKDDPHQRQVSELGRWLHHAV